MADVDRSHLRARRRALARSVQRDAAAAVAARAATVAAVASARRLATYLPHDGELDPSPIVRLAWARGAQVYVPLAAPGPPRPLEFARYAPDTELATGRFGIAVPAHPAATCAPHDLDVVLVPLVAFDQHLTRAGSGAGYYDRTFAFRPQSSAPPMLLGLAYAWQQVDGLDREAWDVPLDLVITERDVVRAQPR